MICLLKFLAGPAVGRLCSLRDDQCLSIGRNSTSDFSVPTDMHMSRFHLILEGIGGNRFRLRDVGSSNGTFVNDKRISIAELCNGDEIRAGESIFRVSVQVENPGENLGGQLSSETVSGRTDDSPTFNFTPDDLPSLSVRSISLSDDLSLAGIENGIANLGQENQLDFDKLPVNCIESARESGFSFRNSEIANLLVSSWSGKDRSKQFLNFLHNLAKKDECSIVFNRSQLDEQQELILGILIGSGLGLQISQSLVSVSFDDDQRLDKLVKGCLGKDAMIVVGPKDGSASQELNGLADLLGFPSMLLGMIKSKMPDLPNRFFRQSGWVLFEGAAGDSVCLWFPPATGASE